MSNRKVTNATLMTSDLLTQTRPQTRQWITIIMDQAIKQGSPLDWLVNWIKSICKRWGNQVETKILVY